MSMPGAQPFTTCIRILLALEDGSGSLPADGFAGHRSVAHYLVLTNQASDKEQEDKEEADASGANWGRE